MPCIIYSFSYSGCKCRFNPNAGLSFCIKLPCGLVRVTEGWLGKGKHPDSPGPPAPPPSTEGCRFTQADSSVRIFLVSSCFSPPYPLSADPPFPDKASNWVVA